MIPKIIHYCWFGRNSKPKLAQKCIKSWEKFCPDFKIIEWNEDNYDLANAPLYVRQAYEAKRWAFVTDYIRLHVVFDHGGIYMDTDVELRKSLEPLLSYQAYFGFEDGVHLNTGLGFGAIQGCSIVKELMDDYKDIPFLNEDGTCDLEPCPARNTKVFLRHGLIQNDTRQILENNILILPRTCLCPIDYATHARNITNQTYSIHWFGESWKTEQEKKATIAWRNAQRKEKTWEIIVRIRNAVGERLLGKNKYERLKSILKKHLR